jgi:hypothetical protein
MQPLQNVFLALLLCISARTTAQIPGYMGKRFLIEAEIQAAPAIFTPTASGHHYWSNYYTSGDYGLHGRYGLGVGYVLSRHQMVQAHVNYLRTGMDVEMYTQDAFGTNHNHYLINVLTALTFDLAYSRTKPANGHIAPLGKHKAYHIYMTRVNGNHNLYESGQLVANQLFGTFDARKTIFGVGYSVTYNKIISDQFVINYGWRINFSSPLTWLTLLSDNYPDDISNSPDYKAHNLNAFKTAVSDKFFAYDFVQFKLGFGLLK